MKSKVKKGDIYLVDRYDTTRIVKVVYVSKFKTIFDCKTIFVLISDRYWSTHSLQSFNRKDIKTFKKITKKDVEILRLLYEK